MKKTIAKVVFLTGILVAFSGTTSFALEWIQVNLQSLSTEATSTELYDLSSTNLRSLWGSGADDIYVAGDIGPTGKGTVIRYNGSEWKVANFTPADADRGLLSVWGIDDENVFIGANTHRTIYHFNGSGWNKISSNTINGNTIAGFWGESVNRIWTPGSLKVILGYEYNMQYLDIDSSDANKAVNQPSTEYRMNLNGVWGSSESNVYVVGEYGCKISWGSCIDGTESNIIHTSEWKGDFTAVDTGSTATLYAIWGTAANDIFAVGAAGTVLHYDGSAWAAMATPANTPDLKAVWGLSGASVYAVGNGGTILYYDGSTWAEQTSDTTEDLTGIWGAASDDIYITGTGGTLLSSGAETPQPVCGDGKIEGDETCEADEDCPS
ncbi:MAG: hypothetical protein GY868_01325, partial [Deltaproteobacteria bacterium]|nr:hypothetical protein [Deltaproteobacteria bacterium]